MLVFMLSELCSLDDLLSFATILFFLRSDLWFYPCARSSGCWPHGRWLAEPSYLKVNMKTYAGITNTNPWIALYVWSIDTPLIVLPFITRICKNHCHQLFLIEVLPVVFNGGGSLIVKALTASIGFIPFISNLSGFHTTTTTTTTSPTTTAAWFSVCDMYFCLLGFAKFPLSVERRPVSWAESGTTTNVAESKEEKR